MKWGRKHTQDQPVQQVRPQVELTNVGAPQIDLKINAKKPDSAVESVRVRHTDRLFILALFGIIVISLLVVFVMGTNVYRSLSSARAESEQMRLQSSLIASSIRANDHYDSVRKGQGPEGPSLVLAEQVGNDVFELRLYQYQGKLLQEYAVSGVDYDPRRATEICQTKSFVYSIRKGLVIVTTDAGQTRVALRSEGGE